MSSLTSLVVIACLTATLFGRWTGFGMPPGSPITVKLNGQALDLPVRPQQVDADLLLPLEPIYQALNARILADGNTRTVVYWDQRLQFTIGTTEYIVGEVPRPLRTATGYSAGYTMVSLSFFAGPDGLGATWNRATGVVELYGAVVPPTTPTPLGPVEGVAVDASGGIQRIATVRDGRLAYFNGTGYVPRFWRGVNLGVGKPGKWPGELAPTKEDYLRWFTQMRAANFDLVRVYTLLPPHFYEALLEFNRQRRDPLLLVQSVWSPEEEMIDGGRGRDAFDPEITEKMIRSIEEVVDAVHGRATIPFRPGAAYGTYTADVSRYVIGFIIGTEWYPLAVEKTNAAHAGMAPYQGEYFRATADATPFESWLARMLDVAARRDMRYGWQHPIAFANWQTTDPIPHPNEPLDIEDRVSIHPMRVQPTAAWRGGYFASYHAYPYYPDFMRFSPEYNRYLNPEGQPDPYAAYLRDLRRTGVGIPVLIAEFGVPTSRGMAHRGPLGRDQGYHTEQEQGRIIADMLHQIWLEGLDGAFVFSWQDEWFKRTWNTMDLEVPDRRPFWQNKLTNESHFGLLSFDPDTPETAMYLDGKTWDWDRRANKKTFSYPGFDLSLTHDVSYLHLLLKRTDGGTWDFNRDRLYIGFQTLPGGPHTANVAPGVTFASTPQFVLRITGDDAAIYVNSAYDQHTWLYGKQLGMVAHDPAWENPQNGIFLPWKLMLNKPQYLPQTREHLPAEEIVVGNLRRGISRPDAGPEFDSLADWFSAGDVLEIRIPWQLLGFMDPSSHKVWQWPYRNAEPDARNFIPVESAGLTVEPHLLAVSTGRDRTGPPVTYTWEPWMTASPWQMPAYHERLKASYAIVRDAFGKYGAPRQWHPSLP